MMPLKLLVVFSMRCYVDDVSDGFNYLASHIAMPHKESMKLFNPNSLYSHLKLNELNGSMERLVADWAERLEDD